MVILLNNSKLLNIKICSYFDKFNILRIINIEIIK